MIEGKIRNSKDAGGCVACDRYMTPDGRGEHGVLELTIGRVVIRLCRVCVRDLQAAIARPDRD